jgi:hypothetical protein
MKESFDFGDPKNMSLDSWPNEQQLPGFHDFASGFYKVSPFPYVVSAVL